MTTYSFDDTIPDAANNPSQDQPLMKINNQSTAALIDVDHFGFNVANGGYHDVIHQPPQGADPAPINGVGQTFTKTIGGDQQLFFESGNGVVSQLTASQNITRGTVNITAALQTIATLPADCVGMLVIQYNSLANLCTVFPFFTDASVGYVQQTIQVVGTAVPVLTCFFSGLNLQVQRSSAGDYTAIYKIIYWAG